MIFNSFNFLWLFPIIFVVYYLVAYLCGRKNQSKVANYLLLVISYALYAQHAPVFTLVLLGVTAVTYGFALLIERNNAYGNKKYIIAGGALIALLPLLVFKYADFVRNMLISVAGGGDDRRS